jgi:Secretion system C-terminal sorting domain
MKKLLLISMAVFSLSNLEAQYFTKEYGSASVTDRIADGTASISGPAGHIMAGQTFLAQFNDLMLIRTDFTGTVGGAPFFQNRYILQTSGGGRLTSIPAKVIQMPSGNIFVAGTYQNAVPTFVARGIYTAIFDPSGAVLSVRGWQATATSVSAITAISACRAATAADPTVYITGNMDLTPYGAGLGNGFFAISVDGNTNVLNWTNAYNLPLISNESVVDIIASPYAAQVMMIGNFRTTAGDGASFMLVAASATGVSAAVNVYNYTGTNESVSAIALNSTAVTGFVICGTTNNSSAVNRVWVFKTTTNGAGITGNIFINTSNGSSATGSDVIQRLNSASVFEFYVSANIATGTIGLNDMVVFKLTNALAVVGGGQFTYGKPNTNESNVEIAAHTDGLGVYGNTSLGTVTGNLEGYVTKAYYNGFTACNSSLITTTRVAPVLTVAGTTHAMPGTLAMVLPVFTLNGTVLTYNICNAVTVLGGSNARLANTTIETEATLQSSVFPNPVSLSSPVLQLKMNAPAEQQIEIRITDMLGREVLNQQISIAEGESVQQIQLPSGLSAGVYNMSISGNGVSENHRFILE